MRRLLPLFLIVALASCSNKQDKPEATAESQPEKAVPVRFDIVKETSLAETITVYGETVPLWTIDVYPDGAGKIIEKKADIGDRVGQNEILARLRQDIPGMEFSPGAIESPREGVITACMIEIGSKVNPQAPAFKVANLDTLKILTDVLETDLDRIRLGSPCSLTIEGASNEIRAVVNKIWPSIDPRSKTGTIEILLPNTKHSYRPGMTVTCRFSFRGEQSLTVPLDAVVRNGMRAGIYKIERGHAKLVSVALGPIHSTDISIAGSLAPGDSIVVYGQNLLREGDKVSIMNDSFTE